MNLDYTFRPIILSRDRDSLFLSPPSRPRQQHSQQGSSYQRFHSPERIQTRQTMAGFSDYNRGYSNSGRVSAGHAIYDGDSSFQRSSEGFYGGRSSSRSDFFEGYHGAGSPRMPYGSGGPAMTTDNIDFSGGSYDRKTPTRHFSLPINTPPGSNASQPESPEGGLFTSFLDIAETFQIIFAL